MLSILKDKYTNVDFSFRPKCISDANPVLKSGGNRILKYWRFFVVISMLHFTLLEFANNQYASGANNRCFNPLLPPLKGNYTIKRNGEVIQDNIDTYDVVFRRPEGL
jgi:hypothetical protein